MTLAALILAASTLITPPAPGGAADGRGFYERVDTHGRVIRLFLMNGFDSGGCDLPCSSVEGYSSSSRNIFDTAKIKIGSSDMRED